MNVSYKSAEKSFESFWGYRVVFLIPSSPSDVQIEYFTIRLEILEQLYLRMCMALRYD